ncbi:TPA: hypothetical protein N0F65_001771 [Lagenidium giganteum]|uniref:Uncharacterized protein n=1 Tax=Lagenidium giganteum TaxID=4803 RepID=A0AAV2Z732_9STRA|nr:TPA: hypothetical protein N0F65_001771 [Lagenidium giganteum]
MQQTYLDVTLYTNAGAVHLPHLRCYVIAGDKQEFILGADTLRMLGIDVDAQLAQLAETPLASAGDEDVEAEPDATSSTMIFVRLRPDW